MAEIKIFWLLTLKRRQQAIVGVVSWGTKDFRLLLQNFVLLFKINKFQVVRYISFNPHHSTANGMNK